MRTSVLQLSLCEVIWQLCAVAHRSEGTESPSLPPALGTECRPVYTLDKTYRSTIAALQPLSQTTLNLYFVPQRSEEAIGF